MSQREGRITEKWRSGKSAILGNFTKESVSAERKIEARGDGSDNPEKGRT